MGRVVKGYTREVAGCEFKPRGHEGRVFHMKNRMACDFICARVWLPGGAPWIFFVIFDMDL
jgi:hypothetical protein